MEIYKDAYGECFYTENNEKINYTLYDSNSDKVAVILPGYGSGSPHFEFEALAKELSKTYKVVIYEPLGYGLSDQAKGERSVKNYCSELHDLMQHLGYDKYTIISHSISGIYGLYYANNYMDEVEGFVGIDSSIPEQTPREEWKEESAQEYKSYKVASVAQGIINLLPEFTDTDSLEKIPGLDDGEKKLPKHYIDKFL
ncbi:MAG: alpha/beta hydrolase [Clostridium butyricum]|nr:alpha/beta hydrolase [Clostridium butyricum]